MTKFTVRPDELRQVAGDLEHARAAMLATPRRFEVGSDELGNAELHLELLDCRDHWERNLLQISDLLEQLAPGMRRTADAFEQHDQDGARRIGGSSPPGTP